MESSDNEPPVKRRKVRKGTRSCWECKGRKAKCTYSTPDDTTCDGCFRRGTSCISQELPEHPLAPIDKRRQIGNRMVRVESLVEKLVKKFGDGPIDSIPSVSLEFNGDTSCNGSEPHRAAPILSSKNYTASSIFASRATDLPVYGKISEALLAKLPPQQSIDTIVGLSGPIPSIFHQLLVRKPYKDVRITEKEKQDQVAELTTRHTSNAHPLIIARQMLLLAISFRYIHPSVHHELEGFSSPPRLIMQKVADAAIDLLATTDGMINCLEGLECLLLAASFQADTGNLRDAWSTIRRALLTAQLMCLHRKKRPPLKSIQPSNKWDPTFLWYRIVYYDRFFSLILGLPQGSTDISMGASLPGEEDTAMGRLEQVHCVLASQILRRNDRDQDSDDCVDAQSIDAELRKLSELMPSKWWLVPNLASIQDCDQLFWATIRLTNQFFHYILLSHLHLPFLLHSSSVPDPHRYEYSRMACVNASRDLLQRYMAFRTFNNASYCCHSLDFFAITASMALILTHFDEHCSRKGVDGALVHQRTSDRAITEEILDNMEEVGTLNKVKTVSEKGASVLRQLLAIEADAARGVGYRLEKGEGNPSDTRALRLSIPYFGVITITQDNNASGGHEARDTAKIIPQRVVLQSSAPTALGGRMPLLQEPLSSSNAATTQGLLASGEYREQPNPSSFASQIGESGDSLLTLNDSFQSQTVDPGFTVSAEEWAFGDGDMSLFDTILRESGTQMEGNSDYWWLE